MPESTESNRRTVVVTGGSAGVGRATALVFARKGWNVAIIARAGLQGAVEELRLAGADVTALSADIADAEAVFAAAETIESWHPIDVWVNAAMATVYSTLSDMSPSKFRRVTEVTYFGSVFGTMAALRHMRRRNKGTIVQVGSALSYRAIPLQSGYCGAFAMRGFTDSLRSELEHDGSSICLTMVQLPAVNTPQFNWSRNKTAFRPQPVPPIFQPEPIGEAIYRAANKAPRELWLGLATIKAILGNMVAPSLLDKYLARAAYEGQLSDEPSPGFFAGNLFEPVLKGHSARGRFDRRSSNRVFGISAEILRLTIGVVLVILAAMVLFLLLG